MTENDYIKAIQTLEPVFFDAGKLAFRMRKDIEPKKKLGTGVYDLDVVTDADIAVQEMMLEEASKTSLSECRLVAEEKTEFADKFDPSGELLLAIDPIDGTSFYVEGGDMFALIVSLQRPGEPIYTFLHYPAIGWTHRFVRTKHEESGVRPKISINKSGKVISYSFGDPKNKLPESEIHKIEKEGYTFVSRKALSPVFGSTAMLLSEVVGGYFCEEPPVVDGLVGLHYGLAHGCEIHSSVPKEWPVPGFGGLRYRGYYYVIRK